MKKIIYYIVPFVAAVVVFAVIVIFINQKTGEGALQVTSKPPSDVYLNGKMIGTTPVCKCDQKDMIGVGEYRLRLVPKDTSLPPYEEKIEVTKRSKVRRAKLYHIRKKAAKEIRRQMRNIQDLPEAPTPEEVGEPTPTQESAQAESVGFEESKKAEVSEAK